uniref:Uncharacterized protein n=1 Tax=Zea mays TaxID=4577 RepID=A0A804RFA5_MAIZE
MARCAGWPPGFESNKPDADLGPSRRKAAPARRRRCEATASSPVAAPPPGYGALVPVKTEEPVPVATVSSPPRALSPPRLCRIIELHTFQNWFFELHTHFFCFRTEFLRCTDIYFISELNFFILELNF